MLRIHAIPALGLLLFAACGTPTGETTGEAELTVFAAAGLTDVMTEMGDLFEEQTGIHVAFNFASSGVLAKQIIAGAPFDVYLSANQDWMTEVVEAGFAERSAVQAFAGNRLVVIAGGNTDLRIESLGDLLAPEIAFVAIADPDHAPAGAYAREALERTGIWEELQPRLVPALTVRAALAYVERGEAEAGIVYRSGALDFSKPGGIRTVFEVPPAAHSPIRFEAVPSDHDAGSVAARFLQFILGTECRGILANHGFEPPVE